MPVLAGTKAPRKNRQVGIAVNPAEFELWVLAAHAQHMNLSEWLRSVARAEVLRLGISQQQN